MKIRVSQELEKNQVKLDYIKGPTSPRNLPSYVMDKTLSDEFVQKYNNQSEKSKNTSILTTFAGAITGFGISLQKSSHKILRSIIGISSGIMTGIMISALVIRHDKNKLMDEYNVKRFFN